MGIYAKIDYENIPEKTDNIKNGAKDINTKFLNIYKEIEKMHSSWYGERYNELVEKFNELVPKLNKFLEVIVVQVPYIFDTVANDISELDIEQKVANSGKEDFNKIIEIKKRKDKGMRFISSEVEEYRTDITRMLQEVNDEMERIKGNVINIGIECEGSEELQSEFNKLAYSFETLINNIEKEFNNLMEKDKKLMEEAEKNNSAK